MIDLGNKVNAITPAYTAKLGLKARYTDTEAQKIDSSIFKIFEMVLASFQVEDKLRRTRFFQETFLLPDIRVEVILSMPFLIVNNADI